VALLHLGTSLLHLLLPPLLLALAPEWWSLAPHALLKLLLLHMAARPSSALL
jgi:hypothetical protein